MDALVPGWLWDLARHDGIAAIVVALISAAIAVYRIRSARRQKPPPLQASTPIPGPRRKVLIVEDDPAASVALRRIVEAEFPALEVLVADTVAEAFAALRAPQPPDVALIDCYLPDGNGWELAATVPRRTRVILMSGAVDNRLLPQLADGAAAVAMRKPIDIDDLIRVVRLQLAAAVRGSIPAIKES